MYLGVEDDVAGEDESSEGTVDDVEDHVAEEDGDDGDGHKDEEQNQKSSTPSCEVKLERKK